MNANEKQQMLFVQLVSSLHGAALTNMGKMKNPATDKLEKNLQQAELTIEMLDMLKEKTKGNLSPDEEKFFASVKERLATDELRATAFDLCQKLFMADGSKSAGEFTSQGEVRQGLGIS